MKIFRILAAIALTLATVLPATAQNGTISPYSRYGYGFLSDNATAAQRTMGGVGYAMNSGRQINVMNPASYAAIDSLTFLFDMGADFTALWSNEGGHRERQYGGGLDYVTMQVPVTKWLGASVGILPYSSVGYSFGSDIQNGTTDRTGSGSINQLYIGAGVNPWRGLYVGFNVAYLFGTTSNSDFVTTSGGTTSLFERQMEIRDWRADIGIQYSHNVTAHDNVTLGLTYSPKKDFHGNVYGIYYEYSTQGAVPDTINAGDTKMNGRYSMPETWGVGLNWKRDSRWMAEVDFTYQPWKNAKFADLQNFDDNRFDNRWRVGAGLQFTPEQRGGYFKRINYRLGGFYNHDYVTVRNNSVRDYGLSMGFGFPVPSFKTIVNLGFEWRHRQASPQALIKEDYFNITLGINFNEMWFRKNKLY